MRRPSRNGRWFESEIEKLDRWAEDRRTSLKAELAEIDEASKRPRKPPVSHRPFRKTGGQRSARALENKREEAWRAYELASRDIDRQKDALLDEVSHRLELQVEQKVLFAVRWTIS